MRFKPFFLIFLLLTAFQFISCRSGEKDETIEESIETKPVIATPVFSQDSAYHYIEKQVAFGPRVPGTAAHKKTAEWLESKFKSFGYNVQKQNFDAVLYNGKTVQGTNLITEYNPSAAKRILLAAHWDTRAFSDKDPKIKDQPIDGANDGGSGVAVLLEIARNLSKDSLDIGVDFILFDVEDWGPPESFTGPINHRYGGWCLGSEYWSKNPHKPNYSAFYGILLDMVGGKNAKFYHELNSFDVAPSVISKVWSTAGQLNFGELFISRPGGNITDDHIPVIENRRIPMIDIIDFRVSGNTGEFFPEHHTLGDNLNAIEKSTLKAVGQTVLHVLYQE